MRVLIAFDKFRGSLSASDACAVAAREIARSQPAWETELSPLTDGGEGFVAVLTGEAHGRLVAVKTTGPRGAALDAPIGFVEWRNVPPAARNQLALPRLDEADTVAVVEMAAASGLALLPAATRDPWHTSTSGTGRLLRAAADGGARAILLGAGGSATNDLGLGALAQLGFEFADEGGRPVTSPVPAVWPRIAEVRGGFPPVFPPLRIACDVTNPLLGPEGATAVFGPQKGLPTADVSRLDAEARRLAGLLCAHCHQPFALTATPGAGAAGGIAFGLLATGAAKLVPGFSLFRSWCGLDEKIACADVVITGEGRFDSTSLGGKGPGALHAAASTAGKRVFVLAGSVGALPAGFNAIPISPPEMPLDQALRTAPERLAAAVRRVVAAVA